MTTRNPRKVPYGWKMDGGKLATVPSAQKIIGELVENRRKGLSFAMIAEALNQRGVPSHRGGMWRGSAVRKIFDANQARYPLPVAPIPPKPILVSSKQAAIEAALAKDPNAETFEWWEDEWDEETKQYKPVWQRLYIDGEKHDAEQLQVQAQALRNLTTAEKADAFRFHQPLKYGFGSSWGVSGDHGIDAIIDEMTRKRRYDIREVIASIKDDRTSKALLTQMTNLLCREIAIQRQENVSLRQELVKVQKDLSDLRNPKPTPRVMQPSSRPDKSKDEPGERPKLRLRRTVDQHTIKSASPKR